MFNGKNWLIALKQCLLSSTISKFGGLILDNWALGADTRAMTAKTNKHGVSKPVQPKSGKWVDKTGSRTRTLSDTVAKKKVKHRVAMDKLARG